MDLFVSRGACPVDSALRHNLGVCAGFCASLQPHLSARDAFVAAVHGSPFPINLSFYTQLALIHCVCPNASFPVCLGGS